MGEVENNFLEVLDKHAPLQHKKLRSKKVPWITNNIKKLIIQRGNLKRKAIFTNLESRNEFNIKLRNAKRNYYSMKIAGQMSSLELRQNNLLPSIRATL